jgi:hypothetical protein
MKQYKNTKQGILQSFFFQKSAFVSCSGLVPGWKISPLPSVGFLLSILSWRRRNLKGAH